MTYDPDSQYSATFSERVTINDWGGLRFLPGKTYQVKGDLLETIKDKVASATKVIKPTL